MKVTDFDNIISSERLTLIDFYATWCGACRAMDPTLDRIALAMSDVVTLVRVDTSAISSIPLVRRYNIVAVPTLILFRRGEVLWRESGILSFSHLLEVIHRQQMRMY
ncbi:MAG: thioredoxin family protein [Alistipes sp.]|nr:thioredoxin family protein [Alistipes sp.]